MKENTSNTNLLISTGGTEPVGCYSLKIRNSDWDWINRGDSNRVLHSKIPLY